MQTIKLHEATKQFKISNKLAMFFLEKKNVPVKSHSSVISMDQLELLREFSHNMEKLSDIKDEFENIGKAKKAKKVEKAAPTPEKEETVVKREAPAPVREDKPAKEEPEIKEIKAKREEPGRVAAKEGQPAIEKKTDKKIIKKRVAVPGREEQKPERDRQRAESGEQKPVRGEQRPGREGQRPASSEQRPAKAKIGERPGAKPQAHTERPPRPKEGRAPDAKEKNPEKRKEEGRVEKRVGTGPGPVKRPGTGPGAGPGPVKRPGTGPGTGPGPVKRPGTGPGPGAAKRPGTGPGAGPGTAKRPGTGPGPGKDNRPQRRIDIKDKNFKKGDKRRFGKDRRNYDRNRKGYERERKPEPPPVKPQMKAEDFDLPEMIQISDYITIKDLAEKLDIKLKYIEDKMRSLKNDYAANQILEVEDIKELCKALNVEVDIITFEDVIFFGDIEKQKAQKASRPPVVTVMGHVDHGKTTLLDTLRNTRVAAKEAGGITQRIGAYLYDTGDQDIIFLDTPGHEAFTNIRSRGARVTDLVILMVAANEGVKPQTVEAINHALTAKVPIIVAINKIDIAGADPNKIKQELTKHNLVVEDWGGDVVSVEISAKMNQNIEALLEMISLVSEMLELKSYKDIPGRGTIIESRLDPKLGNIAAVLIQHGTLKKGDYFICGNSVGKIKAIFDDNGKALDEAEAPLPVEIMGFEGVPEAGELFQVTSDIEKARKVIDLRKLKGKEAKKEEIDAGKKLSLQNIFEKMEEEKTPVFPVVMKTDNFSSGEVLENILLKQSQEKLKINIIHNGIGNITESDILLASTSGALVIGFNVKAPQKIIGLAKHEGVEIKLYNVIYHLIEDVEKAIKGEIAPEYVETKIGSIEVLQKFKISKIGIIAGCIVQEGKVTSKSKLKVLRNNDLVFEGELETLRRVKNDASEVNAGTECGIKVKNFNDIEIGDILEAYEIKIKE